MSAVARLTFVHSMQGLALGEDYRLVNYNVWTYWRLVYGGGPSIGRASKDIYGRSAIGTRLFLGRISA